jgi:5'-nucleotidase
LTTKSLTAESRKPHKDKGRFVIRFNKFFKVSAAVAALAAPLALIAAPASAAKGDVTLTLFHNNDGESKLLPQTQRSGATSYNAGSAAAFKAVYARERADAAADKKNSIMLVYAGDSFLASATLICSEPSNPKSTATVWDSLAQRYIGYNAHVLGNHEFDYGTGFLRRFIDAFADGKKGVTQPFLSANLNYAKDPNLKGLTVDGGVLVSTEVAPGKVLAESMIYEDPRTKEKFGVVAAITPLLQTISSPLPTVVTTPDIKAVGKVVQKQVRALEKQGINKIILVSHLQNKANDELLIRELKGIDVAVAGGGDELLANPAVPVAQQLLPGSAAPVGNYPLTAFDKELNEIPLVTTAGDYLYLGRIDLTFDKNGKLKGYDTAKSYPRRVVIADAGATALGVTDAVQPNFDIYTNVQKKLEDGCLAEQKKPFASSGIVFNTDRGSATAPGVRTVETNGGNLVADAFLDSYNRNRASVNLPAASATTPVVAVTNGGGIRIPRLPSTGSDISRADTFNLLPFDNRITAVQDITPAQLKDIFERSCAIGTSGGGQFLQVSGMKVTCSRSGTAHVIANPTGARTSGEVTTPGTRVRTITLDNGTALVANGAPVAGAPNVTVVTNSFTAGGGDNYPTFENATKKTNFGVSYEQALYDYLLSFPRGANGLPTVPATDARYLPAVNTRIFWVA